MVEQAKVIAERRAYLFRLHDLRLSTLTMEDVATSIQTHFGFRTGSIATPPATFGAVPETMPPGLAFNLGTVQPPDGPPVPIRFLHFEPQRIVVDVAGPSSAIDQVFDQLQSLLKGIETPDGSPVIAEPTDVTDYSEVTAQLNFDFEDLLSGPLLAASSVLTEDEEGMEAFPVSIVLQVGESSSPIDQPSAGQALQIRAGTRPDERMYYSAVGWPTDQHLTWLETLEQHLTKK